MSEAYNKLIKTLQSLFEMDKADLDFGIYRIMNQKQDEIRHFLENDLLTQVKAAFADFTDSSQAELKQELQAAIEQARKFGAPAPENTEAVLEIKKKLASKVDITAVENEVFSHLHTFFSSYYNQGDFISLRRYKKDIYAIPYEGEEVKLYWANYDQYYIKSSEHLRDYAFTIQDGDKTVRIKLVEADTEKDNVKAESGKERRFVLDDDNPLHMENGELHIRFHYRPAGKKRQVALNQEAVEAIFYQQGFDDWLALLKTPAPTEKNLDRTLLEKHLNDYTARNTFDYFIHKDLGGFLHRELDFYIKNEVLFLDDIDDAAFQVTETHLRKIKVLRSIAHKIIRMLAQLEDFQKKLWLKKKFVVETNYCITLDRVPEELYGKIAENRVQHEEWVKLGFTTEGTEITEDFLRENTFLVLDSKFFGESFKHRLLASIEDLDEQCDGLLIQSENFQALQLAKESCIEKVDCIYIDPPYNTSENSFLYKNSYRHSSWVTMLSNRIILSYNFLRKSGVLLSAIDDTEYSNLKCLLGGVFGVSNYVGTVAVEVNPAGQNIRPNAPARSHDYFHVFAKDIDSIRMILRGLTPNERKQYKETDGKGRFYWDNLRRRGGNSRPIDRPKQWFPLFIKANKVRVPDMTWDELTKRWKVKEVTLPDETEVWPIDPKGEKRIWRVNPDGARREMGNGEISVIKKAGRIEIVKKSREPEGKKPKTLWCEPKYSATSHGTKLLLDILGSGMHFSYPKSIHLTTESIRYWSDMSSMILDYFAGSGTTGHAVINLNREDGGKRKYILVEMGEYFDTVLKSRIQKVIYSKEWKDGKPKPDDNGNLNGISHCFKYLRLESYEDTLNNLILKQRTKPQEDMLASNPSLREDYMLGYWLDVETTDSPSLLNIKQFEDPFDYKLNIATGSVGATKPTRVDLVETFNYLIGLRVKHIDTVRGLKVVTGTNPKDESVLVIWRNLKEKDNATLEALMEKQAFHPRDTEFDHIYVNGDHTLETHTPRSR